MQPARSYTRLDMMATMSLVRCVMLNLLRSGLKVTLVKSPLLSLMMVLPDLPMLDVQVWEKEGGDGGWTKCGLIYSTYMYTYTPPY